MAIAAQISEKVAGDIYIQVNPFHAYNTDAMVDDALRLRDMVTPFNPWFDRSRICVKIPSTWEGLQACGILQSRGVTTLATIVFTIEQAMLAGEMRCEYIAPYVNELRANVDKR